MIGASNHVNGIGCGFGGLAPSLYWRKRGRPGDERSLLGHGGRCNIISISWIRFNTSWGLRGSVGGSRYHTGTPSVKSCKLRVSKTDLLTISDGRKRKRKRIMLSGNEPHCFLGN